MIKESRQECQISFEGPLWQLSVTENVHGSDRELKPGDAADGFGDVKKHNP